MDLRSRKIAIIIGAALCFNLLAPVAPAFAIFPPPIKDEAKFFSAVAIEKANKKVRDIYRASHRDVVVETFLAIPADLQAKYKEDKQRFYIQWAQNRIDELGIHGVYVLITKEPAHLHVEWERTIALKVPDKDQKKLVEDLLNKFRAKKFDDGLTDALDHIQSAFRPASNK